MQASREFVAGCNQCWQLACNQSARGVKPRKLRLFGTANETAIVYSMKCASPDGVST